jgi:hypothetical protein
MRFAWVLGFWAAISMGAPLDDFVAGAKAKHGEDGERAARFLVENMPEADRGELTSGFLAENLDLALKAREEFPWAKAVPEAVFLNDVLPYAVFNEPRDAWRADFYEKSRTIVKGSTSASEAAQRLNRQIFNLVNVHYNTGRKRPNQSPKESMASGKATCTGLSIILVDACRSVGIPARAVGTPMWANERGNHTWVEIWDGDWHFTGADEPDPAGLDRGWFVGDASEAKADVPKYAIYATSWKRDGLTFPMVWSRNGSDVQAVNVTTRYARANPAETDLAKLGVRLWDAEGGSRMAAKVCVLDGVKRTCAVADTKAGTADLNDMPRFALKPGTSGWLRFTVGDTIRDLPFGPLAKGSPTVDAVWSKLGAAPNPIADIEAWLAVPASNRPTNAAALETSLTKEEAAKALDLLAADRLKQLTRERKDELDAMAITLDGKTLRWMSKTFGEAPSGGRSLWISMHGGGNAPSGVNDRQWTNQIKLYEPAEGVYVAPRAPTDTWNLWHESHINPLFQRLIDDHVALLGVNPDRVYLMGYSAGGDGVWQLAPRMADRFAAAAMMAGHPNEASLLGLRNLPFAIFMGGNDGAYDRNKIAAARTVELDRLGSEDPGSYLHMSRIYSGLGHWMNRKDAEALPWMSGFQRSAWPAKIVWLQDDVFERRFYWLQVPAGAELKAGQKMVAKIEGRKITVDGDVPVGTSLRLSDRLLDLDRELTVVVNGREAFRGKAVRRAANLVTSLNERADRVSAASAVVVIQ